MLFLEKSHCVNDGLHCLDTALDENYTFQFGLRFNCDKDSAPKTSLRQTAAKICRFKTDNQIYKV